MKIAVLIKYYKGELNPFDGAALECALTLGGEIYAVTMAPPSVTPALEALTRLGVKAVHICDNAFAGSDTVATSYVLAEALRRLAPDIIFTGRQSIDGDTAQVPPMIAERLGIGLVSGIMELCGDTVVTRDKEKHSIAPHTLYSFEKIKTLRFPSIFSKKGEVKVIDNNELCLDVAKCGLKGSPTRVICSYESTVGRRDCASASVLDLDRLINEARMKEKDADTNTKSQKVKTLYYVGRIKNIAKKFSRKAIELFSEGKTARELADEISSLGEAAVLFESTPENKRLASSVAVLLDAGLCADCISFRDEGGRFVMTRPALGGSITADIVCDSKISLATVRAADEKEKDVIFAIGRGAVEHIGLISKLADKYGAEIVSSRVVADSGIMPYSTQVGLTGRTVSPKVYVAFGVSGAVQHTCAISGARTVIAVNSDKNARIFDYADYGIVTDIKNLF